MSPTNRARSHTPVRDPQSSGAAPVYAALLEAHEMAGAGQPLLTTAGVCYLRQLVLASRAGGPAQQPAPAGPTPCLSVPYWDAATRRLWLGARVLKEFRQPAPNQTAILGAFQEDGWAAGHIDDPLPPAHGEGPEEVKRRLQETVKNLNRGLPPDSIRFRGDGSGEGVRWEFRTRPRQRGAIRPKRDRAAR
jgi:hypothetical protein